MSLRDALAALLLRGPTHGYELHTTLDGELGPLWSTRQSQAYVTVGRMVRDGLVATSRVRQETRPDRRILTLTESGRRLAEEWLEHGRDAEELVVRLAIGRLVRPEHYRELVQAALAERMSTLHELRVRREAERGFAREAIGLEIARVEGEVRWLASQLDRSAEIVSLPKGSSVRTDDHPSKLESA